MRARIFFIFPVASACDECFFIATSSFEQYSNDSGIICMPRLCLNALLFEWCVLCYCLPLFVMNRNTKNRNKCVPV